MGRFGAHCLEDLPPPIAKRVHRIADAIEQDRAFTADELAEAAAILAAPPDHRQHRLDLTPHPSSDSKGRVVSTDDAVEQCR